MPWVQGPLVTTHIVAPQHPTGTVDTILSAQNGAFVLTGENASLDVSTPCWVRMHSPSRARTLFSDRLSLKT